MKKKAQSQIPSSDEESQDQSTLTSGSESDSEDTTTENLSSESDSEDKKDEINLTWKTEKGSSYPNQDTISTLKKNFQTMLEGADVDVRSVKKSDYQAALQLIAQEDLHQSYHDYDRKDIGVNRDHYSAMDLDKQFETNATLAKELAKSVDEDKQFKTSDEKSKTSIKLVNVLNVILEGKKIKSIHGEVNEVFVLTLNDEVVGLAHIEYKPFEGCDLTTLSISPEHQQKGYGSLLISKVILTALENNCTSISDKYSTEPHSVAQLCKFGFAPQDLKNEKKISSWVKMRLEKQMEYIDRETPDIVVLHLTNRATIRHMIDRSNELRERFDNLKGKRQDDIKPTVDVNNNNNTEIAARKTEVNKEITNPPKRFLDELYNHLTKGEQEEVSRRSDELSQAEKSAIKNPKR